MGKPWSCRTTFSMLPRSIAQKLRKRTDKSKLWDTFGPALASFWLHFACPAVAWRSLFRLFVDTWATLCRKVGSCDIDATLERNRCLCRSGRPSWSHLGQKSGPVAEKWFEVASQSGSVRGALSKLWKLPRIAAPQPRTKSDRRSKSI